MQSLSAISLLLEPSLLLLVSVTQVPVAETQASHKWETRSAAGPTCMTIIHLVHAQGAGFILNPCNSGTNDHLGMHAQS